MTIYKNDFDCFIFMSPYMNRWIFMSYENILLSIKNVHILITISMVWRDFYI